MNKLLGKLGEIIASKEIIKKGFILKHRNYHSRYGEIDLVFLSKKDPKFLLFCEVKTRRVKKKESLEVLSKNQIQKIIKTIFVFIEKSSYNDFKWQLDLIMIQFDLRNLKKHFFHYKNILNE